MSDEFKDVSTVPTLTLEPFQAEEEKKPAVQPEEPKLDDTILTEEERRMVDAFAQQIDLTNSSMILQYGAGTQKKMADFSESALENVKSKDLGEVGTLLTNVVTELKSFDEEVGKFADAKDIDYTRYSDDMTFSGSFDTKEVIIKKIKGATTDSENRVYFDEENKPGISNLLNIASVMTGRSIDDLVSEFENAGYGTFKAYVGEVTSNKIGEIQNRYNELLGSSELEDVLKRGAETTTKIAKEKYELMREKVGLK